MVLRVPFVETPQGGAAGGLSHQHGAAAEGPGQRIRGIRGLEGWRSFWSHRGREEKNQVVLAVWHLQWFDRAADVGMGQN